MINTVLNSGLQGIVRGVEAVQRTADNIAALGNEEFPDINAFTTGLVELKSHEHAVRANVFAINVADSALGTLLDEYV